MARIRSVHPEICRDEEMAQCSASAERTFVRLWCHLDDEGRAVDNVRLILSDIYPLHDDVDSDAVDADLDELAGLGLLIRYEVAGRKFLSAKPDAWIRYQKPRHPSPSKIPGPPESHDPPTADSGSITAECGNPPAGVGVGVGVVAAAVGPQQRKHSMPDDWAPTQAHHDKAAAAKLDLAFEADQFRNFHLAKGSKFVDWDRAFHTWLGNARKWSKPGAPERPKW